MAYAGCPTLFWDIYGEQGYPVRATISEMAPLLIGPALRQPGRGGGEKRGPVDGVVAGRSITRGILGSLLGKK